MDVSHNALTGIPPLHRLSLLKDLFVNNNQLSTFPLEVLELTTLERLDLSFNQIANIPPGIDQLKKLRCLFAESNRIRSLPLSIEALASELVELRLDKNELSFLPVELVNFTELKVLSVDQNGLEAIPKSVVREVVASLGSPKRMQKYLQDLLDFSKMFNRLKLMFVGDGGVGKTTLLACFDKEKPGADDEEKPAATKRESVSIGKQTNIATDGIDIAETRWQG